MKALLAHLELLLLVLVAIFAPVKGAALTALSLCILDMFTGLLAAHKQKLPISSRALGHTIIKIVVYEAAIVLTFLVDTYLAGAMPLSSIVSGFIGITELKSNLENLNIIVGGSLLQGIISALGRSDSSDNSPKQ